MDIWLRSPGGDSIVSSGEERLMNFWGRDNRTLILCSGSGSIIKAGRIGVGRRMGREINYKRLSKCTTST